VLYANLIWPLSGQNSPCLGLTVDILVKGKVSNNVIPVVKKHRSGAPFDTSCHKVECSMSWSPVDNCLYRIGSILQTHWTGSPIRHARAMEGSDQHCTQGMGSHMGSTTVQGQCMWICFISQKPLAADAPAKIVSYLNSKDIPTVTHFLDKTNGNAIIVLAIPSHVDKVLSQHP
jgi:hypothetical protein